jgi:hypothetical protein
MEIRWTCSPPVLVFAVTAARVGTAAHATCIIDMLHNDGTWQDRAATGIAHSAQEFGEKGAL